MKTGDRLVGFHNIFSCPVHIWEKQLSAPGEMSQVSLCSVLNLPPYLSTHICLVSGTPTFTHKHKLISHTAVSVSSVHHLHSQRCSGSWRPQITKETRKKGKESAAAEHILERVVHKPCPDATANTNRTTDAKRRDLTFLQPQRLFWFKGLCADPAEALIEVLDFGLVHFSTYSWHPQAR